MCGKEYPVVNTEAVCLFRPTDFLRSPSQELVLESGSLLLPPGLSASTHLTSYILWLTISESCWAVTVTARLFPDSISVTYMHQNNGFWTSFAVFQDATQRLRPCVLFEVHFFLGVPVTYCSPNLTFLTPTHQVFRKHTLLPPNWPQRKTILLGG